MLFYFNRSVSPLLLTPTALPLRQATQRSDGQAPRLPVRGSFDLLHPPLLPWTIITHMPAYQAGTRPAMRLGKVSDQARRDPLSSVTLPSAAHQEAPCSHLGYALSVPPVGSPLHTLLPCLLPATHAPTWAPISVYLALALQRRLGPGHRD